MKLIRLGALIALLMVGLFSSFALALEESDIPAEGISQGDFAMWLVEAAGAESSLPQAALPQDAIKFLNNLGIAPKDGWDADKTLTKENLAEMLGLTSDQAAGKSWADLVNELVQSTTNTLNSMAVVNQGAQVSPTVSPSGAR